MKTRNLLWSAAALWLAALSTLSAQLNTNAVSGLFIRWPANDPTNDFPDVQSFVIALDLEFGIPLPDIATDDAPFFGGVTPWFALTARAAVPNLHIDFGYTLQQNDGTT